VSPETSHVLLLVDPDARVSALADESRAHGMIEGNGSPHLEMTYLDLDSEVAVDEIAISSGVGGIFPKGIRIGKITALKRDSDGLHLRASVKSFVNFNKIEELLCIESLMGK